MVTHENFGSATKVRKKKSCCYNSTASMTNGLTMNLALLVLSPPTLTCSCSLCRPNQMPHSTQGKEHFRIEFPDTQV